MKLVIVESPTKAKTIQRFLKDDYTIKSSFGHIRDLPRKELGVDIEHNFKPKYIIPLNAKKRVLELKGAVQKAKSVILATDEDREGEAISWHLEHALKLKNPKRIVFHEITKGAIKEALKNPRVINMNLVDAQQARRILDRLVGYKLSPFLWRKVARGLSAGRVQSVTVRLVVEREREIEAFKPQEYWSIEVELQQRGTDAETKFIAKLIKGNGKSIPKLGIKSKKEADKIVKDLKQAEYKVTEIEKKEVKKNPLPPFTTSTLQQIASWKLRMSAKQTMMLAQNLYEKGFITYHRTDSLNISNLAISGAEKFITDSYGKKYWAGFARIYKAKGRTQEAHEAIRPTYPKKTPDGLKDKLEKGQFRLYDLIWRRFIASQMAQALLDSTKVEIEAGNYTFQATGQILKFDGFLKVYPMKFEESEFPPLKKKDLLKLLELKPWQHFTQPPSRYSEAGLIKALEQEGIGRPSTYAPIISTIQDRNYVTKNETKKFQPTEMGKVVTDLLVKHFPKIVDVGFTAQMEEDLDKIAQGDLAWIPMIKDFYKPFKENLEKKYEEVSKKEITEEKTKKTCPKCSKPLVIKLGRFGKFLACSGFPECKYTEPLGEEKDLQEKHKGKVCDKCGAPMVIKHGRFGPFLACSKYPDCKNIKSIEKTIGMKCPKCSEGEVIEKKTKRGRVFYGCNRWPKCDFASWQKPKV